MTKGTRNFTRVENKAILEVLLKTTQQRDAGTPPSALEFLESLKDATKKTFSQDKLFTEARRVRDGMRKRGVKLYVPSWRESDDWMKWTEEWKNKAENGGAKKRNPLNISKAAKV